MRRVISIFTLTLIFVSLSVFAFDIKPAKSSGTTYIRADGSINPPEAPISSLDNITYSLTANISDNYVSIQRDNIIFDGAGYTLAYADMILESVRNVTVKNMCFLGCPEGMFVDSSADITIVENNITNCYYGIFLNGNCVNVLISRNNITNSTYGINTYFGPRNVTIAKNNIVDNSNAGVLMFEQGHDILICENNVTGNKRGVALDSNCYPNMENCTILRNNISNNTWMGISLRIIEGCKILENYILNNEVGVNLYVSGNNTFYHNNFVNNTQQVYIDEAGPQTPATKWNEYYPFGGNYWNDHTNIDEKCGPNQDFVGHDGLSDTPHVIDTNNTDQYPLVNKWIVPEGHDVAIAGLDGRRVVGQNYQTNITIYTVNQGEYNEEFQVFAYIDTFLVGSELLFLTTGECVVSSFPWDTMGWKKGNYTVMIETDVVPSETDVEDNILTGNWITITIPGDIDGDQYVNAKDAIALGVAFYPSGEYNPNADINGDGYCNAKDAIIIGTHFNQHWE